MHGRYLNFVDNFVDTLISGMGQKKNNFLAIKHYNTFDISDEDIKKIRNKYSKHRLFYHSFYEDDMLEAYAPFMGVVKELYLQNEEEGTVEDFLDECGVYSQQKELFASYIRTGECKRREEVILSEVDYEQERMIDSLIKIMIHCSEKRPFLLLLNGFHLAGETTITLMKRLFEYEDNGNIGILLAYNSIHSVSEYVAKVWEECTEVLEENGCVINGEMMMNQGEAEEETVSFHFESERIDVYLKRIHNMYETLDLEKANYYLQIIYRKIEMENLYLKKNDKVKVLELYAKVLIMLGDIQNALMVCENLQNIKWQKEEGEYLHSYLLGTAQMYSGNLKGAMVYAQKCKNIATNMRNDFFVFKAELLEVMSRMSGWYNIMFCAEDVEVEPEFLKKAEKYGYWNHLAYIYIFAYDNSQELFREGSGIEERLVRYKKGVELAQKIGNQCLLTKGYHKNVMLSSICGMFDVSEYYYIKWREVVKDSDPFTTANIYNGMGYNSCTAEKYEKANEYYNKALNIFYDLGKVDYIGETLYNMALNCMLAEDYKQADVYLGFCMKIVNKMKLNDLRVCNISKLFGLMALCNFKLGKMYNAKVYLKNARQFLSHIMDNNAHDVKKVNFDPSYTLCDDDIFLYYYVRGLIETEEGYYKEAEESYNSARIYIERSIGFQFFGYVQYHVARAKLFMMMNKDVLAKGEIKQAISYAQEHKNLQKAMQLQNLLEKKSCVENRYNLKLQRLTVEDIIQIIKQAGISKEYEELKKQMEFLSVWQKMIAIEGKSRKTLVENALNTLSINTSLDGMIFIKYYNGKPQILYENTKIEPREDMIPVLENYFTRRRSGFVTSKLQANYSEYSRVISLFGDNKICSMLCIPFYVNEKLDSIFVTYITMKDNWSSSINKYMLDETDYNMFALVFRQFLDSLSRLETNSKIQKMNAKLEKSAITDFLTGLYNRDGFFMNMENMLEAALNEKNGMDMSLIYVDLDNFKYYNDTFGHDVGDMVLKEIAQILKKVCRNNGFASRFGGDEFLVVLVGAKRERAQKTVQQIMDNIQKAQNFIPMIEEFLERKVEVPENKKVTCSMGIVLREHIKEKQDFGEIIKEADQALYTIKRTTKNGYSFAE